ncbi:helix-turn-helix domain-containing protein [Lactiplantibacillus modestisalitolerans]|uniref:Helix-turn-helix domain-containing protein n=1 Tax=Lactiplantibacillus modestisalitolerans TaxID=1457219 RepID=A0ABV5WQZ5_9LACO|nr:helix-turn-helix transcriptional regulator [Lactiplantibacillus modestisalitolerans]
MEFSEKLQRLRTGKGLTQEQLAKQLYVSRTAISKWESGKGYPNIDSLKSISAFFSVTIDELLSSEELIDLAETENASNIKRIYNIISGMMDVLTVGLIVLPIYGELQGNNVYHVNLLSITHLSRIDIGIYWVIYLLIIGLGIAKLAFVLFDKERLCSITSKASIVTSAIAICLFSAAREPYATILLFLFFVVKIYLLLKQIGTKQK